MGKVERESVADMTFDVTGRKVCSSGRVVYTKQDVKSLKGLQSCIVWALRKGADFIRIDAYEGKKED